MAYELSYGERLKVGWLWLWRGLLVGGLMGFLLGIVWGDYLSNNRSSRRFFNCSEWSVGSSGWNLRCLAYRREDDAEEAILYLSI